MKVLKLSKDTNTNNIIFEKGLKEGSLAGHVLVADDNFGKSSSKEQEQLTLLNLLVLNMLLRLVLQRNFIRMQLI